MDSWHPGDFYAHNGTHCDRWGVPVNVSRPNNQCQCGGDWPHAQTWHAQFDHLYPSDADDPRWKELADLKRRIRELEQQLGI